MKHDELGKKIAALLPADSPLRPILARAPNIHRAAVDDESALTVESSARELQTIHMLLAAIDERERTLRRIDISAVMTHAKAFEQGPRHHAPETLRMLHELRLRAYGKVVFIRPVGGGEISFRRVAQANIGVPEIFVLNRLAPLSQQLVSAEVGDEIQLPKGKMEVVGVANLDRYAPEFAAEAENFRKMEVEYDGLSKPITVEDLARTLRIQIDRIFGDATTVDEPPSDEIREVRRGDTERLGAHFYTRTTKLQESLMQRSEDGVAVILGVAGSGKTSVALGRTKVLCDRLLEEGEDRFFRTETAIGFVLSSGLCTYLERTCQQLALYDMPVQEYHQLRSRLVELRRLVDTGYERDVAAKPAEFEGSMAWLMAVESGIARVLASTLRDAVATPPGERETPRRVNAPRTAEQEVALRRIWEEFANQMRQIADGLPVRAASRRFHLEELATRIDDARAKFARQLESDPLWKGVENRELRQNARSATRERIVRALRLPEAYGQALATKQISLSGLDPAANEPAFTAISDRLAAKRLSDRDLDLLLSIAHVISLGYRGRQDRDPISHLTEPDWYSQVFIDEFQDFSEVQLFLMGAQANPSHRTVTVVGDYRQKLSVGGTVDLARVFPWAPVGETTPGVLLENKRQAGPLARLSQIFRETVLGDDPHPELEFARGDLPRFVDSGADGLVSAVAKAVLSVDRQHSVAVMCPTEREARELELQLRDELGADFRQTRFSTRADLVARFYVHFTTPLEAKGLEFDAAIVCGIDGFDLSDVLAANACYVALSRPRRELTLIGDASILGAKWGALLTSDYVRR